MTPAERAARAYRLLSGIGGGDIVDRVEILSLGSCGCCGSPWAREGDVAIMESAPTLADDVITLAARVEVLTIERDRLARILAVERGDASAAPEGWHLFESGFWVRQGAHVERSTDGWCLYGISGRAGYTAHRASALEAMEAADAALRGDP